MHYSPRFSRSLGLFIGALILMLSTYQAHSQVVGAPASRYINQQLRVLFNNIAPPNPQPPVFYDMAAHFTSDSWYEPFNTDTSTTTNWSIVYDEMWFAHYDTTQFLRSDTVASRGLRIGADSVRIGLIDYNYCRLVDSAIYDTTYFYIDTTGPTLIDNPNATASPYELNSVFTVCAMKENHTSGALTFSIDPDFLFIDPDRLPLYTGGLLELQIDFGDGQGWVPFDVTTQSFHAVTYATAGEHILQARTVNPRDTTDSTINYSASRIASPAAQQLVMPQSIWTHIPGMDVEVYRSCDIASQQQPNKFIIMVPGFDAVEGTHRGKRYKRYFKNTGLADLRNHGYTILVIDWHNSKLPTAVNALRIPLLIDYLKCNLLDQFSDPQHQFVMMGASSGALMARYALTWMEQNPNFSACWPNLHHNTRLYFSLDGEHQGAYIPLAFQEYYDVKVNGIEDGLPANLWAAAAESIDILNSPAATELLNVHYTTRTGNAYGPHVNRDLFMDDMTSLNGNNGYPEHVKMFAIGNGLFTGEHQTGIGDECVMEPGDFYLDYDHELTMTVLGIEVYSNELNLELRALDNGQEFYRRELTTWKWQIQLNWMVVQGCLQPFNWPCWNFVFPLPPTLVYETDIDDTEVRTSQGVPEWDVQPGSRISGNLEVANIPAVDFSLLGPDWTGLGLTFGTFTNVQQTGGCPILTLAEADYNGIAISFDMTVRSQTLSSCFTPNFSAIDYQGANPQDHDLYNENITVKMTNTPFDVIVGEVNGQAGYPQQPQMTAPFLPSTHPNKITYPSLNRAHVTVINHLVPDTFLLNDTNQTLFARYINREIGDEQMFLDNIDFDRLGIFQAEYNITAGVAANPFYEYPSQTAQALFKEYTNAPWVNNSFINPYGYNLPNNAIFSQDDPFRILPIAGVELIAGTNINDVGMDIQGGLWQNILPQWVCVVDSFSDTTVFNKAGSKESFASADLANGVTLFPNPVAQGGELSIGQIPEGDYELTLRSMDGRVIQTNAMQIKQSSALRLTVPTNTRSGLYLIQIRGQVLNATFRVIVL